MRFVYIVGIIFAVSVLNHMKKLSLLLLFFVTSISFSQKHALVPAKLNTKLLETLILERINHVRDTIGLPTLVNDNALHLAALHHSKFLVKNKSLTHTEPSAKYKTPLDRVKASYGTHTSVAENVAYVSLFNSKKRQIYKTYEYLADKFVKNWVKSKGHFKNIKWNIAAESGVSVQYDSKTGRVYATQVFGNKPFEGIKGHKVPSNKYGLKDPTATEHGLKHCQEYYQYEMNKPGDVYLGVYEDNGYVYAILSDARYYPFIIKKAGDGLAVDIVLKEQYECGKSNSLAGSFAHKGLLLMPRYQKDLEPTIQRTSDGQLRAMLGKVPEELKGTDYEINLLSIQNHHVCRYQEFFNIERFKWQLLDMPFLTDKTNSSGDATIENTLKKNMKFTIPFQKGKSTYSKEDIKPLYDSLKLTDYSIKSIKIRAYSSVEGRKEVNLFLQKERANSIVKALQSFQEKTIKPEILTAENWPEFAKDIRGTEYAYLMKLSKEQVKQKLRSLDDKLEPILSQHRKGIVYLDLEKKEQKNLQSADEAIKEFNAAISSQKLDRALQVQLQMAKLNGTKNFPKDSYTQLNIPKKSAYSLLLNNQAILFEESSYKELYTKLVPIYKMNPTDIQVVYNLAITCIHLWAHGDKGVTHQKIKILLEKVRKSKLDRYTKERLEINYLIVLGEYLAYQKEYQRKDQIIHKIREKYSRLKLNEKDLLSLAQYLTAYSKQKWAEDLLAPYATKIDVNEDLLFYYINLTVIDRKIIQQKEYKEILLNAMNLNQKRFCKIFNSNKTEGITFQLLENTFLKLNYCEACN